MICPVILVPVMVGRSEFEPESKLGLFPRSGKKMLGRELKLLSPINKRVNQVRLAKDAGSEVS